MKQIFLICAIVAAFYACQKNNSSPNSGGRNNPGRTVTDTLMVYAQTLSTGKSVIQTKYFGTNEIKTLVTGATDPFAQSLRMVYIKNGTTLGFSRFDGISRPIAQLTQGSYPTLSIDMKLICVVDKPLDKYQLLLYDTLGNRTLLFESVNEVKSPAFSSDGSKIVFAQKTGDASSLFIIPITGGSPKKVTNVIAGYYDDYCTITDQTVYFVRSHFIDSTLSSEIFSSDFGGSAVQQVTNFTNNWSTPSFWIKNLRKVATLIDSSSLICVSNYNNSNSEVFLYKIGGSDLTRMTETEEMESSPNMIPNYTKNQ